MAALDLTKQAASAQRPLMTNARHGRASEQGSAILFMTALLSLAMALGYGLIIAGQAESTQSSVAARRQAYLNDAATTLRDFYTSNPSRMDADTATHWSGPEELAREAGLVLRYGARLDIGQRQSQGDLRYRTLTLWIPAPDASNSSFTPANASGYRQVSGLEIQRRIANRARRQLTRLSNTLVVYYAGRLEIDPLHSASVNYWQGRGCSDAAAGDFGCSTSFIPLVDLADPSVGLAQSTGTNPWGQTIQGRNRGSGVETVSPPYTLQLRSLYPWGGGITKTVVQPLGV